MFEDCSCDEINVALSPYGLVIFIIIPKGPGPILDRSNLSVKDIKDLDVSLPILYERKSQFVEKLFSFA